MLIPTLPVTFPDMVRALRSFLGPTEPNLSQTEALASAHTFVIKINSTLIFATGNYVRLAVMGPQTAGTTTTLSNTFIGVPALSGDAWDFLASPTRITWSGNNDITVKQGELIFSDIIPYTLSDVTTIVAFDVASGSVALRRSGLIASDAITYFKASTTEAGTANKSTGYTPTTGTVHILHSIAIGG